MFSISCFSASTRCWRRLPVMKGFLRLPTVPLLECIMSCELDGSIVVVSSAGCRVGLVMVVRVLVLFWSLVVEGRGRREEEEND